MALNIASSKVSKLYLGDTECKKAYLGDILVFDSKPPKYIAGIDWHEMSLPNSEIYSYITYGEDKFIAVPAYYAGRDYIIYSQDGILWSKQTLPQNRRWRGIAYGNGIFVLCGSTNDSYTTGAFAYSSDGLSWNVVPTTEKENFSIITYGNNKFIAISNGYGGTSESQRIGYSYDGKNWTFTNGKPSSSQWEKIVYGNGIFIATISDNPYGYVYSTDGINWKIGTNPETLSYWVSIAFGNGKFVGMASNNKVYYSEDAKKWYQITLPFDKAWYCMTFGDDKFVALSSYNSDTITGIYSYDGIDWQQMTMPFADNWSCVTYGGGKFVAMGQGTGKGAYSYTGNEVI